MNTEEYILEQIKHSKEIPKNMLELIKITGDGNCLYRTFSYFLYNNEDHYKEIRKNALPYARFFVSLRLNR